MPGGRSPGSSSLWEAREAVPCRVAGERNGELRSEKVTNAEVSVVVFFQLLLTSDFPVWEASLGRVWDLFSYLFLVLFSHRELGTRAKS